MKHVRLRALESGVFFILYFFVATNSLAADRLNTVPGFTTDANLVAEHESIFEQQEILREQIIKKCMAQIGFSYESPPTVSIQNISSIEEAQEYAKLILELYDSSEKHVPTDPLLYNLALYGIPDADSTIGGDYREIVSNGGGGCLGKAYRTVLGIYDISSPLRELYIQHMERLSTNPITIEIERDYIGCLGKYGFVTESSRVAFRQKMSELSLDEKNNTQLRAAEKANESCVKEVKYTQRYDELKIEYRNSFADIHIDQISRSAQRVSQARSQLDSMLSSEQNIRNPSR